MTLRYGLSVGLLGLVTAGCGSDCVDDGFAWQQSVACMMSATNSESNSESGTESESNSESDTNSASNTNTNSNSNSNSNSNTGTDTQSSMSDSTSTTAATMTGTMTGGDVWCDDNDGDGFGDPNSCHPDMTPGSVPNGDDCDDSDPDTFPGAAPNDSPTACMTDVDGDDWGDSTPGPGVEPGSDCSDGDAGVHDTCVCPADSKSCVGDDLHTCNAEGSGEDVTACEFGCDDADPKCWDALVVDAGPSVCVDPNNPAQLDAVAMGGDGNYAYNWTPAAGLSDPMIQNPTAMVMAPTNYTVNVSDGEGNMASDSTSIFLTGQPLNLDPQICTVYDFPHENNANNNDPVSSWSWDGNTSTLCETLNAKASALFCDWTLENSTITGAFGVGTAQDDDWIGFLWGMEDTSHFYAFTWKQLDQLATTCDGVMSYAGMQVKVIDVVDPVNAPLTCADIHEAGDTANSKLLLSVDEFTTMGWEDNTNYIFELTHLMTGDMSITVRRADNMMMVAQKDFNDTRYPSGKFAMYTKSQINACFSGFTVSCEP